MPCHHPRPWHRGSLYGPGPRRPLDRDQRARFRYLLSAHRRARRLSPRAEHVGMALLKRLSVDGRCDPSHDTLADDAGCSARTVRRATAAMRMLGMLHWQTRITRNGWRVEQTSNAYQLVPDGVPAGISLGVPTGGQTGRGTPSKINISLAEEDRQAFASRDRQLAALGITMELARKWAR